LDINDLIPSYLSSSVAEPGIHHGHTQRASKEFCGNSCKYLGKGFAHVPGKTSCTMDAARHEFWLVHVPLSCSHPRWATMGHQVIAIFTTLYISILVGGFNSSERSWSSSVGMMTFPISWESHKIPWFQSPPTSIS
jgi:hypothetical protein